MTRIVSLSGSLRRGSWNTVLAHALADRAPDGCNVEVVDEDMAGRLDAYMAGFCEYASRG